MSSSSSFSFPPMPRLSITSPETIDKCKHLPLRPSDVFICSYPKSGTTWTQHIVLSLIIANRRHDNEIQQQHQQQQQHRQKEGGEGEAEVNVDYEHVSDFAPFFDIDAHWEPQPPDGNTNNNSTLAENVRVNHARLNQRVFNTHLRWDMLPKQVERQEGGTSSTTDNDDATTTNSSSLRPACGKFIYVTRNLPDVCTSFYHHLSNQKEGQYTESFETFAQDWMAGKIPFGSPLHHLLSFAEGFSDNKYSVPQEGSSGEVGRDCDKQPPLLLLSYERMKSNLRQEVLRIIDFLNLDNISTEVLDEEILPTFQFQHMKANANRFQPKSVTWLNGYQFLRRGESGDGKNMFMNATIATTDESSGKDEEGVGRGTAGGAPLIQRFREWVEDEEYCKQVAQLMDSAGLGQETAEIFHSLVRC